MQAQQVVNGSTCARSMLWSHTQTGSCRRPAASVWLWLSGIPFLTGVSSHRCVFLCVYVPLWRHVCVCVCSRPSVTVPVLTRYPIPPRRISRRACRGPHHSQSRIHGKFNFFDTLGWFVPWHGALSRPANCVSNWKSKRRTSFTMGPSRAKYRNVRWGGDGEKIVNVWVFPVHSRVKQPRLICYTIPCCVREIILHINAIVQLCRLTISAQLVTAGMLQKQPDCSFTAFSIRLHISVLQYRCFPTPTIIIYGFETGVHPFNINIMTGPRFYLKISLCARQIRNRHGSNGSGTTGTHMLCQRANWSQSAFHTASVTRIIR